MKRLIKYVLPLVLFFSCSDEEKETIPIQKADFCSLIHRNDSVSLGKELKKVEYLLKDNTGVYVIEEGGTSLVARAWLCEYAERSIDIQYFIFSTDNVGLIACDYLVRAADRGVKVRIIVDDIMVEAGPEELLTLDAHENISIRIYNPGCNVGKNLSQKLKRLVSDFGGFNQRMHNKTFTVDGKVVITGGRNIADEYFDYDHEYNFRDRDVMFMGKAVTTVQNSFELFWNDPLCAKLSEVIENRPADSIPEHPFERLHQYACNPENFWPQVRERIQKLPEAFNTIFESGELLWTDKVNFVSDVPGKNKERNGAGGITTDSLIALVNNAKKTIDIQSPYLITTELGKGIFKAAVERRVKVRILTNSLCSTDNMEAFGGYQKCRKDLLSCGVRIFEFKPDAACRYSVMTGALQKKLNYAPTFGLHAKSMVIDGETTVIGTFNLDPRSANYNTECVTIIRSEQIAQGVLKGMEEEFKPENSWETTLEFNPDAEASKSKRLKTWTKKVIPKGIL
jgi:cardiolipin synthase C